MLLVKWIHYTNPVLWFQVKLNLLFTFDRFLTNTISNLLAKIWTIITACHSSFSLLLLNWIRCEQNFAFFNETNDFTL